MSYRILLIALLTLAMLALAPGARAAGTPRCAWNATTRQLQCIKPGTNSGTSPAISATIGKGLDAIPSTFYASVDGFGTRLAAFAREIMSALVVIEFVFTIGRIVLAGGDLGEMLQALLMRMLIVGGFIWLTDAIPAAGGLADWVSSFAGSLFKAGTGSTAAKVTPGTIFQYCWSAGAAAWDASGTLTMVPAAFVFLVDVVIGAVLAGELIVTYIELHIVFAGAIAALGFAPWGETRGVARNVLFSTIGAAFRLFGMLLVGAVTVHLLSKFQSGINSGAVIKTSLLVVGQMLILMFVAQKVPKALEAAVMSGAIQSSKSGAVASAASSFIGGAAGSMAGAAFSGMKGMAGKWAGGAAAAVLGGLAPTPGQNAAQAKSFAAPLSGGGAGAAGSVGSANTGGGGAP